MKYLTKSVFLFGVLGALSLATQGCGGSDTNTSGTGGSGNAGGGGTAGAGGATGGTAGTGGTITTGGAGGGGGGSSDNGAQASAFVNAGGKAKSQNYQMVFTLGQATPNQARISSANFTLQGGIIGATGAFK